MLKRNQEKYMEEFKELTRVKRKGTNITDLETRIYGLESRLKYTQKDRDTTVRIILLGSKQLQSRLF